MPCIVVLWLGLMLRLSHCIEGQAPGDGDPLCTEEIIDGIRTRSLTITQCTLLESDLSWTLEIMFAYFTRVATYTYPGRVWIEIITILMILLLR